MDIKQEKQEIMNTLRAYLSRDELGNYLIPAVRLRYRGKAVWLGCR